MKNHIGLILFLLLGLFAVFYYKVLGVCDGEKRVYTLEIKSRLVDKYFSRVIHLKFYNGKDTIEPYGMYSDDLENNIVIGDSLFKPAYSDSCFIYKKSGVITRVIYGYSDCPENERIRIKKEIDESSLKNAE